MKNHHGIFQIEIAIGIGIGIDSQNWWAMPTLRLRQPVASATPRLWVGGTDNWLSVDVCPRGSFTPWVSTFPGPTAFDSDFDPDFDVDDFVHN